LIQPVSVNIDHLLTLASTAGASTSQPLLTCAADRRSWLKAELLEASSSRKFKERCFS